MGLIDIFRKKEENVHFERDERGRVIDVSREKSYNKSTPVYNALTKQYKQEQKDLRREKKENEREIYRKAFEEQKMKSIAKRAKKEAEYKYGRSTTEKISDFIDVIAPPQQTRTVSHHKKKKSSKKKNKKRKHSGSNKKSNSFKGFDITDNWGFLK